MCRTPRPLRAVLQVGVLLALPLAAADLPAEVPLRFWDGIAEFGHPIRTIELVNSEEPLSPTLSGDSAGASWPRPHCLVEELSLIHAAEAQSWIAQVQSALDGLAELPSLRDPRAAKYFELLEQAAAQGESLAGYLPNAGDASHVRRISYALSRRTQLWRAVHHASQLSVAARLAATSRQWPPARFFELSQQVEKKLASSKNGQDWVEFLGFRSLSEAAQNQAPPEQLALAAMRVLRGIYRQDLSPAQEHFLQREPQASFLTGLQAVSTLPIELAELLRKVERLETTQSPFAAAELADLWDRLRWSQLPEYQHVAEVMDLHYRNANIRMSMTEQFANRFLPAIQHVRAPVREQILGADVQGQSDSLTRLHVRLVPDPDEIRVKLEADGYMASQTHSRRGPVTTMNRNGSRYIIQKLLSLDPYGIRVGRSRAAATADTQLLDLRTQYDTFPILGTMVRRVARQKHEESRYAVRRIIGDRVASHVRERVDAQLEKELHQAQQQLTRKVIQPLEAMDLAPQALAMHTTEDRMVLRGRLASSQQMAAFTARPRAPRDSLASIQVHESAINNFLDQMPLSGREVELRTLVREILDQWELKTMQIPADIPEGVFLQMIDRHPVQVHCQDGRLRFELYVKSLSAEDESRQNGQKTWRNFKVTVHYVPMTHGFACDLHRDGCVELQSLTHRAIGFGDQVALRAIFTKVFSKNRPIQLIQPSLGQEERLANLTVDQCILRDGWFGISVREPAQVDVARRRPATTDPVSVGR